MVKGNNHKIYNNTVINSGQKNDIIVLKIDSNDHSGTIVKNNVAVLEINNSGLLKKKEIYDINNMKKYKFTEETTKTNYEKDSYIYNVLTSLRQKINAPTKRKRASED